MRRLPVRLYAAFAARPDGGNIAGVVYDDHGLTPLERQRLAADLGAPTTGFVRRLGDGAWEVGFFSPSQEMSMCGHVTVGVFCALHDDGRLPDAGPDGVARAVQRTVAGDLPVEVRTGRDGRPLVEMRQNEPVFATPDVAPAEVAARLGLAAKDVATPLGIVSTALRHLFVCLPSVAALAAIRMDNAGLLALSRRLGVDTIGVWPLHPPGSPALLRVRDLCHGMGNPEGAASGTTNGALACWLARQGLAPAPDGGGLVEVAAAQGVEMGRPSLVRSRLLVEAGDDMREVKVGGSASRVLEGDMLV